VVLSAERGAAAEGSEVVSGPRCSVVVRPSVDGIVVSIAGEFDVAAIPEVTAAVRPHVGVDILVDLEEVTFIDSSGLHCLFGLRAEAADVGRRLRVAKVSPVVARVFEMAGVAETLRCR
jgi:anti-anti-sigma factor